MIYELLRRDPAWRFLPLAVVFGCLCWLPDSPSISLGLFATSPPLWLVLAGLRRRASLFDVALPIPARELFSTRCVAFAGLVWLPVLAAIGAAFLKQGPGWDQTALALIDCGAAATVTLIAVLSVRLNEMDCPLILAAPLWFLGLSGCAAAFFMLPAAPVLVGCALASIALFVRAWRVLPESFQVAPVEARGRSERRRAKAATAVPWLTLLRSLVPLSSLLFLPMICQLAFMSTSSWPILCFMAIFIGGPIYPTAHWLHNLPIAKSKLLAIAAAEAILFVALPYSVCVAFGWGGHTSFRLASINVICIVAVILCELILLRAWACLQMRRLPGWFRSGVFLAAGISIFVALSAAEWRSPLRAGSGGFVNAFMLRISDWLPANEAAVLAIGAALLAALCWLLEMLDAQAEWPEFFGRGPATGQSLFGSN